MLQPTGSPTSVPLFNAMEILGRDICRERLRQSLALLGGVSAAEAKAWEADAAEAEAEIEAG